MLYTMVEKVRRLGSSSRRVLADGAYDELFVSLMDGRLEAGASISIDQMARELDVSPTPVREALARMESTGMVVRTALKGYRVTPPLTPEELGQLMDARCVIESANAAMACARSTKELCDALNQTIDDLKDAPHGPSFGEYRSYWVADERFHRLIAEHADNRFLLAAFNALGGLVQRFRSLGEFGVTDAEFVVAEHAEILDAFVDGDAQVARSRMETHILNAKQRATPLPGLGDAPPP